MRRAAMSGETDAVARIGDLAGVVPTLRGKVEFDVSEEGQEEQTLQLLARRATADAWRAALGDTEMRPILTTFVAWFDDGNSLIAGDSVPAATLLAELGPLDGLGRLLSTLEPGMAESPGVRTPWPRRPMSRPEWTTSPAGCSAGRPSPRPFAT